MGHGPPPPFGPPPPHHVHGPPPPPPHAVHHQQSYGQAVPILGIIWGSIVLIVLIINVFKFAQFYLEHHATHAKDSDKAEVKPCNGNCQCQGLPPNANKQRPGIDPPPYSNNNELEERRRLMDDEDGTNYVP